MTISIAIIADLQVRAPFPHTLRHKSRSVGCDDGEE